MKNIPCVLTLDFGTQSVRVSIIDRNGEIKCLIKESYSPAYFSTKTVMLSKIQISTGI